MRRSADPPLRGNQAGFHPKARFVKHGLITFDLGQIAEPRFPASELCDRAGNSARRIGRNCCPSQHCFGYKNATKTAETAIKQRNISVDAVFIGGIMGVADKLLLIYDRMSNGAFAYGTGKRN